MIKEFLVPRINTNDDKVQIAHWHIKEGDLVEIGDPIVDVETSKANVTIESEFDGYAFNLVKQKEIVSVGAVLCIIADSLDEKRIHSDISKKEIQPESLPIVENIKSVSQDKVTELNGSKLQFNSLRFSKKARTLIKELKLDPDSFINQGLITSKYLLNNIHQGGMIKKTATKESDVKNYSDKPIISRFGPITPREESLNVAKREEISQLSIGESGLINSTLTITFDSQDLRESVNSKGTLQASIQPIILYEIAQLLPHWPQFTAYFENNEIHYYDRVDLGIAIDLDMGLKVLRIKDAELETIDTIKESVIDFSMRYMRKELKPEELVGSTITVTDLSSLDILYFHPLINGYQSAIIGIGSDSTILGHPTSLIMTFDHRISTGREAASFLKILRKNILRHVVSV